jgi:hypothetical protein
MEGMFGTEQLFKQASLRGAGLMLMTQVKEKNHSII